MITHNGRTLFTAGELQCRDSGLLIIAPGFADKLKELRVEFNQPMIINSACRSREYNDRPRNLGGVGGHPRSLHVCDYPHWPTGGCCAVDVSTHRWTGEEWVERGLDYRSLLEWLAWDLGWSIGYGRTFLHLDRRTDYIPKGFMQHKQTRFNY